MTTLLFCLFPPHLSFLGPLDLVGKDLKNAWWIVNKLTVGLPPAHSRQKTSRMAMARYQECPEHCLPTAQPKGASRDSEWLAACSS